MRDYYDVVVIGSGLGGLTGANYLAKQGHSVLLLEHHYQFGGLATWFKRAGGHIFDISLHGFPVGMIKSCKRYWTKEIADSIVQLKNIRFINPQYDLKTTFDRSDFTRILQTTFNIAKNKVEEFYDHMAIFLKNSSRGAMKSKGFCLNQFRTRTVHPLWILQSLTVLSFPTS